MRDWQWGQLRVLDCSRSRQKMQSARDGGEGGAFVFKMTGHVGEHYLLSISNQLRCFGVGVFYSRKCKREQAQLGDERTGGEHGEELVWLEARLSEVVRGWIGQLRRTGRLRWTRTI